MDKAGVPIVAGTDVLNPFVFPGFSLHDELGLLVQAGLTPAAALRTATVNAASYLGTGRTSGTIWFICCALLVPAAARAQSASAPSARRRKSRKCKRITRGGPARP